jgi:GntR family transcriptional regulator, transcriptional repressor for pyruvate dehydrogenase complex
MAQLVPIKRQSMYEQVIDHLKHYITENHLQPGDKLPTEQVLAEDLGVNRLTVREALKVMESLGIVRMRPRHGIQLQAVTMKPIVDHLQFLLRTDDVTFAEMVDARLLLEVSILPLVVERAEEQDFRAMEAGNEAMRSLVEQAGMGTEGDMQFHQALIAAAQNRALAGFASMLHEFFRQVRENMMATEKDSRRAIAEHRAIIDALRRADTTAAQDMMREHLGHYLKFARPLGRTAAPPE